MKKLLLLLPALLLAGSVNSAVYLDGVKQGSSGTVPEDSSVEQLCDQTISANGDQTSTDPEVSLEAAEAALSSGGTICVKQNLTFTSNDSVSFTNADIKLICTPGVVIAKDLVGTNLHNTSMIDWDGDDGWIDGCTFDFNTSTRTNVLIDGTGAARLKITNSTFQGITLNTQFYIDCAGGNQAVNNNIFTTAAAGLGNVFDVGLCTGFSFIKNLVGVSGTNIDTVFVGGAAAEQAVISHNTIFADAPFKSSLGWSNTIVSNNIINAANDMFVVNPATTNLIIRDNIFTGNAGAADGIVISIGSDLGPDNTTSVTIHHNEWKTVRSPLTINLQNADALGTDDHIVDVTFSDNRGTCAGDCVLLQHFSTGTSSAANFDVRLFVNDNTMEGTGNDGFLEASFLATNNDSVTTQFTLKLYADNNDWFNVGTSVDENLILVSFLQAVGSNQTYDILYDIQLTNNKLRTTDADALSGIVINFGLGTNINAATGTIDIRDNIIDNAGDDGIVIETASISSPFDVLITRLDISGNKIKTTSADRHGIDIRRTNSATPVITNVAINNNNIEVGTGFCISLRANMAGGTLNSNTCVGTDDGICFCNAIVDNFAVSGNFINVNDGASGSIGFLIANGSDGHSVVGNVVVDVGGNWAEYNSIEITASTNDIPGGNSFTNDEDTTATDDALNSEP